MNAIVLHTRNTSEADVEAYTMASVEALRQWLLRDEVPHEDGVDESAQCVAARDVFFTFCESRGVDPQAKNLPWAQYCSYCYQGTDAEGTDLFDACIIPCDCGRVEGEELTVMYDIRLPRATAQIAQGMLSVGKLVFALSYYTHKLISVESIDVLDSTSYTNGWRLVPCEP